jgi:tetratricopeptide (TPR) repeat protein
MSDEAARPDYNTDNYEMPIDEAIELARSHHLVGNFVLAERTYKDVLKAMPNHPTANHLLGALYYQLNNVEQALHYIELSLQASPDEIVYLNNYGGVLGKAGYHAEAIQAFDKVLKLDANNVEAINHKTMVLWQQDESSEAEALSRKSLELAPANLEGLIHLGLSLAQQKKHEEAITVWRQASELYPNEARIWSSWAIMLRDMGQPGKAKALIDKAIAIDPQGVEALNNLGCILKDMGRAEEAIEAFTEATNITPKHHQAHYNLALTYGDLYLYKKASIAALYAISYKDDYAEAYNALSGALIEMGVFDKAQQAAQRALQLTPNSAEAYLNMADVLYLSERFDDGHAALKEALKLSPDDPRSYVKLANIYERLDAPEEALEAINKAIELAPEVPMCLLRKASLLHVSNNVEASLEVFNQVIRTNPEILCAYSAKAEALIALNRTDEALATVREGLAIDKTYPPLYFTLANLKTFKSEDDEDFQNLLKLQDKAKSMGLTCEASINFALAKAYDSFKKDEKAFEHYIVANTTRRKALPYNATNAAVNFERTKEEYSAEALKAFEGLGSKSDTPIFIVGMPRSGTTLTEQIISSHPDIFGAGELGDIPRMRRKFGVISEKSIHEMGETYVEYAQEHVIGGPFKHITDKMPGNYLNIGLIASILPNAKIIHCCRNPFDTCLSNYKQNFMMGQHWSYDLEELGQEYLRYLDLMAYWHKVLPGRIHDISYEETVGDLETQARKLIDFVGVEWNDACAMPHKQKRTVLTASKMQVTQPVYKTSVEKWKVYEKQLQPLVRIISPELALSEEELKEK